MAVSGCCCYSLLVPSQAGEGPVITRSAVTRIGAPPTPTPPEIVSIDTTTVSLRLYPVVSEEGPTSFYEIWVQKWV